MMKFSIPIFIPCTVFAESNHLSLCFQQKPLSLRLWQVLRELAALVTDGWGATKRRWGQLEHCDKRGSSCLSKLENVTATCCYVEVSCVMCLSGHPWLYCAVLKMRFFFSWKCIVLSFNRPKTHCDQLQFLSSGAISIPTMALLQMCKEYCAYILYSRKSTFTFR